MNSPLYVKAKKFAYRLLKFRIRSEQELISRLQGRGIPEDVIGQVLKDLKQVSLVNDKDFALAWTRDRLSKGYGELRIKEELREKGIEARLISDSLKSVKTEYNPDVIVKQLVQKKVNSYKDSSEWEKKRKISFFLKSRGFMDDEIQRQLESLGYEY